LNAVRKTDIVKKLQDREDFETRATIPIFHRSLLEECSLYILSENLLGKARRRVINPEGHYFFDFENEDDAICFKLKFAGTVHTNR